MFDYSLKLILILALVPGLSAGAASTARSADDPVAATLPVERLMSAEADPVLRELLREVDSRSPEIEQARAQARAAEQVGPQVRALPDPTARLTAFLLEPETRVGPQELTVAYAQAFPWFGTLPLRERAAVEKAIAVRARVEATRLRVLTEARRWYHELAYLKGEERVLREERRTLRHFEDLARARYESGRGLQQGPIKIQAEITRIDLKLLALREKRASALAAVNGLRRRPGTSPLGVSRLPDDLTTPPELSALRRTAAALRPEVAAADAEIASAATRVELARKRGRPNFTVGAGYTLVGGREDAAGRANPPPDNGDDVFAVTAAASLPIWRGKVRAGVAEASELRQAAGHGKASLLTRIERQVSDYESRLRVSRERVLLHDELLVIQAEQSLSSGLSAYSAGSLGALELLDAERVLFAVRLSAERARADHAIALARLEGAIGAPLGALLQAQPPEVSVLDTESDLRDAATETER